MKGISYIIDGDTVVILLDKEYFEKSAIFAASYKFTHKYIVQIEPEGQRKVSVSIVPKQASNELLLKDVAGEFMNEVLDQQVRLDLERRYGSIRELIVRHAFAPIENLKNAIKQKS